MAGCEGDTLYYIEDFSDEVMPCAPALDAWATWLAAPADEWGRHDPIADGTTFATSVMRMEADIIATRQDDGSFSFSRSAAGADFVAIRFAQHMGWDAESILWGEDMDEALREWLADIDNNETFGDVVHVAIGTNLPDVTLVFNAGPPPSMTVLEQATVQ
jgi:hypothetical protein